jgi:hypothetical protein
MINPITGRMIQVDPTAHRKTIAGPRQVLATAVPRPIMVQAPTILQVRRQLTARSSSSGLLIRACCRPTGCVRR